MSASPSSHAAMVRRPVLWFAVRVAALTLVGLPVSVALMVPPLVEVLRRAPPDIAANLDAFLVPTLAALAAGALGSAIVSSSEPLRTARAVDRRRAVQIVGAFGAVAGVVLYAALGWGLPLLSRRGLFPHGLAARDMLVVHPFLLTSPELGEVQRTFRSIGGFSSRVALTLELRAWLAASLAVSALASAAVAVGPTLRSRSLRIAAIALLFEALLIAASALTTLPAVFLDPFPLPQLVAWVLLAAVVSGLVWYLRRTVFSEREEAAASPR